MTITRPYRMFRYNCGHLKREYRETHDDTIGLRNRRCDQCERKERNAKITAHREHREWTPSPIEVEAEKIRIRTANEAAYVKGFDDDQELVMHGYHRTGLTHGVAL